MSDFKIGDKVRINEYGFQPKNPEGYSPDGEGFQPGAEGEIVDLTPGGYAIKIAGMAYMPFYPNELEPVTKE